MIGYTTKSPILFLIFNRPDVTSRVFEAIRQAQPDRLYIAADGPRTGNHDDLSLCEQTRAIVDNIDWHCKVFRLFRNNNLGCKEAISLAIDWFFEHEEEGIILEDDCLPAADFFKYCDQLLEKYRNDTRIRHIAGANLQAGKKWGTASVYFTNQTHVWGWASWRRVWKDYDKNLSFYDENEVADQLRNIFDDPFVIEAWERIFKSLKAGKIDTWDYQLAFTNFFNNGLSINPNVNLITNIGFRNDATHTLDAESPYANMPTGTLQKLSFPKYILPEKAADYAIFTRDFNLDEKWRKHNLLRRQFKRWLKAKLTSRLR